MIYRWGGLLCSTFTPLRLRHGDTLIPKLLGQPIRQSYAAALTSFASQPHDLWSDFPLIEQAHRRLADVVVENQDFGTLIRHYDRPVTFFYCDPPYHATEGYYQNIGEDGFKERDHMAHFRVDRLAGVEILESTYIPQPDFDVADYTNKMIDMFAADRTVCVELLCENRFMKTIMDYYGEAVPTFPHDSNHFVTQIEVNPSGTFYGWIFKFMGGIKIVAPQECVEEMARVAHEFL